MSKDTFKSTPYSLEGKVALITGGLGLLGLKHSEALLEADASVVAADVKDHDEANEIMADLKEKYGSKISYIAMDVKNQEDVKRKAEILDKMGLKIDILINNAAINPKVEGVQRKNSGRLEDFTIEQWDIELDVGLKGAFICSKIFGTRMKERNGGVILNVASDLAVIGPDQRIYEKKDQPVDERIYKPVTYSVVKNGIIGLTKYLATYWPEYNIRCNAISPGGVLNGQEKEFLDKVTQRIPMGRLAKIDEYKATIQFLCSDASSYMTGHNLVIDGGRSTW